MSDRTDDDRPDPIPAETDEVVETDEERVGEDDEPAHGGPADDGAADDDSDEGAADDELADVAENEAELKAESELDDDTTDDGEPEAAPDDDADLPDDDADGPAGEHRGPEPDALVSRLRLIGEQPLAERAASLAQLHDELRARLESGDPARR